MADHFTHFSCLRDCAHVIDLGARESIGWTSRQEWLAAALNGDDVDA